ncbi:urease accessory protein UreD [Yoonia sp. 1_MG-2023]|uniref:urease accessory protein UreD n=1 Tax=Yoonia sp. 1_MG-2023 TaxID=3062659 RepID=UPI0026E1FBBC|nr:urease accessory protein UreD [Yoonia sp. 1_MG-2023]MDO6588750.1 urease accessory protein UreD [Yoonia sp. 1_MG-2023]
MAFCWKLLRDFWQFERRKINRRGQPITYAAQIHAADAVPTGPRAKGALVLTAKRRGAETVIADLRQEGSLKALFPRVRGDALDAVFLNTAGGLTGGDQMQFDVTASAGAHITLSSQAAERGYRAHPGQIAQSKVALNVGSGGRIDWIPQETILFESAALDRQMHVHLAADATALIVEPVIFGRPAMGEDVRNLRFTDQWRIWRDNKLVFADALRLIGDAKTHLQRRAIAGNAGAMATIVLAGPQAQKLDLPETCGASLIADDLLLVRLLAEDGFALRRILIPVVEALSCAPIPRVWRL